jgi:hypothetical protein
MRKKLKMMHINIYIPIPISEAAFDHLNFFMKISHSGSEKSSRGTFTTSQLILHETIKIINPSNTTHPRVPPVRRQQIALDPIQKAMFNSSKIFVNVFIFYLNILDYHQINGLFSAYLYYLLIVLD